MKESMQNWGGSLKPDNSVLHDIATGSAEPADHFKLHRYYISEALDSLDGRAHISHDEMA